MKHVIKCNICEVQEIVNGQKQITEFCHKHSHFLPQADLHANLHIDLDPIKESAPGFFPGVSAPVHDYWHKVPGSM
jgi:hypothetical protein